MKAQKGMRTPRQSRTRVPVKRPPTGVFTPLAAFTAVRLKYVIKQMCMTNTVQIQSSGKA